MDNFEDGYGRGWREARELCLAIAEKRTQGRSVLKGALPVIDAATGSDMATEHEWFVKGRHSAATNIAEDIRSLHVGDVKKGEYP